jgi:hypothetical protein
MKKIVHASASVILMCALFAHPLYPQVKINTALKRPASAEQFEWYLAKYRPQDSLFIWIDGQWQFKAAFITHFEVCNEILIAQTSGHIGTHLFDRQGKEIKYGMSAKYICGDSVLVYEDPDAIFGLDYFGSYITRFRHDIDCPFDFRQETLQGETVICICYCPIGPPAGTCRSLKTWGMLGQDGHWKIEPKFDAPFHFQNGTAEVIYYGQRRKINEKGDFVE